MTEHGKCGRCGGERFLGVHTTSCPICLQHNDWSRGFCNTDNCHAFVPASDELHQPGCQMLEDFEKKPYLTRGICTCGLSARRREAAERAGVGAKAMPRTFEYRLNAMERAAQEEKPAEHGYAAKRKAVFEYVVELWNSLIVATTERDRLAARVGVLVEALEDAAEHLADCIAYKGDYLVKKHGDLEALDRARAALAREGGKP